MTPAVAIPVVKTLYLVRHGEAVHNIEEQRAKRCAAAEAEAQGHVDGSKAHKAMVEAARKAALKCENLRDAPLSTTGRGQTVAAKDELQALTTSDFGLPEPAVVLVSPLQRTLETAAILFPDHPRVLVYEDLRERRTGLPCDERKAASDLARQSSFSNMDFSNLIEAPADELEDSEKLRSRTARLAEALRGVEDSALCLVTHKAFLREMERGPLGHPEAKEFSNCEIRAYRVVLMPDGSTVARRLHCAEVPWAGVAEERRATSSSSREVTSGGCGLHPLRTVEKVAEAAITAAPLPMEHGLVDVPILEKAFPVC
eukprot:CAMPEP_0171102702 /NCGR_PEP_ID=MMETSP0766_2-20121228/58505_1 /TAXON_ID=439317 /ORGANISM="Gambierdiscus australes, Strain CAWD 149" /LENGTH=313 /DNA_ID=CAMNT_0011563045 /DNA_START=33 /DNA_END=974 /DNA_ORIENTATION=-